MNLISKPLISVVIPVKNGEATIFKCLEAFQKQTYQNFEVIIIDSGSSDQTLKIASDFVFVKIIKVEPNTFNHGTTRNIGMNVASGDFFFYTVQDAIISESNFFEKMILTFEDPDLVGICGQQVVAHDRNNNPHEWYRPISKPTKRVVQYKNTEELLKLPAEDFRKLCSWDNVVAMYRGNILRKFPFKHTSFGEDKLWAIDILKAGYKIMYDTSFTVLHYHHQTFDFSYKRTLTVLYYTYKYFGVSRNLEYKFIDFLKVIPKNFKYKAAPSWILFNWKKMKGVNKANFDFKANLKKGEGNLESLYTSVCSKPPQGFQNIK